MPRRTALPVIALALLGLAGCAAEPQPTAESLAWLDEQEDAGGGPAVGGALLGDGSTGGGTLGGIGPAAYDVQLSCFGDEPVTLAVGALEIALDCEQSVVERIEVEDDFAVAASSGARA